MLQFLHAPLPSKNMFTLQLPLPVGGGADVGAGVPPGDVGAGVLALVGAFVSDSLVGETVGRAAGAAVGCLLLFSHCLWSASACVPPAQRLQVLLRLPEMLWPLHSRQATPEAL